MAGYLSRAELEAVFDSGGTVLHKGKTVYHKEDLPSAFDLAETVEQKREALSALERAAVDAAAAAEAARAELAKKTESEPVSAQVKKK